VSEAVLDIVPGDALMAAGFVNLSNAFAWGYPELSDGDKMTYVALARFTYGHESTFVSQKILAKARRVSTRTIRRHLRKLEKAGLIEVKKGKGRRTKAGGRTNLCIVYQTSKEMAIEYLKEWRGY